MPTARQHFEKFPEPYRSQAIENTLKEVLKRKYKTPKEALLWCFTWCHTLQKYEYWKNFYHTLC